MEVKSVSLIKMTVLGSVIVTAISVLSVAVNALFIVAVVVRKKLRSDMVSRLVISLAVSDLCSGLFITGISAVLSWFAISMGIPRFVLILTRRPLNKSGFT